MAQPKQIKAVYPDLSFYSPRSAISNRHLPIAKNMKQPYAVLNDARPTAVAEPLGTREWIAALVAISPAITDIFFSPMRLPEVRLGGRLVAGPLDKFALAYARGNHRDRTPPDGEGSGFLVSTPRVRQCLARRR